MFRLKKQLDALKNRLGNHDEHHVRLARQFIEGGVRIRNRCYLKIKDIDEKYNVCKNVETFLDLCGGPGQFAKYVFDVNNHECSGYGVTLRNHCDYTFDHVLFRKMYGCFDTGDIFDANVVFELMYFCRGKCDLVVADGAFDVKGNENNQESLSYPLIAKECMIILGALRTGGNCVLKIFDTFESSTISLLQEFISHFDEHYLYKPLASRAANAEKYLVCKGKLNKDNVVLNKQFDAHTKYFAERQRRALKQLLFILENDLSQLEHV
ncbi:putative methyltransferase [Spodoptera frugiperda multiple nucleopolyhedrovirus]|uniref:MET n=1 Tax=Spodoptera frugiperda nuclear polyhedrosis virus TaxID=10455 RepID=A1YJ78_NPVSF|nr:putative methyltransferase [Spodoptera frugiperda multiple nucleopolyhedrovirus]ABM45798.1 putative methyltransferase [Spodoptera frugiperda multiple nucleopolyhedrovirus]ACA02645.1 MET [Spodoptera frugiperda multiple nucleopolyhedrovirus]ADV91321.1 methyltransferase [Spodoptera frugiperda multiple nucleopolyhedrovirus]AFH59032.1 methyltransferase [Spodoptera frugiperda multiple nucleopolyhedrovirus]AIW01499.1 methyltransferase protein [Spodoptera frugiperda multiple nucleopolyhedrovirus]